MDDVQRAKDYYHPWVEASRGIITALEDFREQWEDASDGYSHAPFTGCAFDALKIALQKYVAVLQRPLPKMEGSDGSIARPGVIISRTNSFDKILNCHLDAADTHYIETDDELQTWLEKHPAGLSSTGSFPIYVCEQPQKLADISDEFLNNLKCKINRVSSWMDEKSSEEMKLSDKQPNREGENDETDDSDSVARLIYNAKTPEDLEGALHLLRVDDDFARDGFERADSKDGFERYRLAIQQVMVNMRRANPKLPAVPTSNNDLDYVNWCFDAKSQDDDIKSMEQPKGGGEEQSKGNWKDVQGKLLVMYNNIEPYTSINDLAKRLRCSNTTVHKAIHKSPLLEGWQARHSPKSLKVQSLNDFITDNTSNRRESKPGDDAAVNEQLDNEFARLMQDAESAKRAEWNTKTQDEQREIARLSLEQIGEPDFQPVDIDKNEIKPVKLLGRKA